MLSTLLDSSWLGFSKGFSLPGDLQPSTGPDQDHRTVGPVDERSTGRVPLHVEVQQISLRRNQVRKHPPRLRHSRSRVLGFGSDPHWREDDLQILWQQKD